MDHNSKAGGLRVAGIAQAARQIIGEDWRGLVQVWFVWMAGQIVLLGFVHLSGVAETGPIVGVPANLFAVFVFILAGQIAIWAYLGTPYGFRAALDVAKRAYLTCLIVAIAAAMLTIIGISWLLIPGILFGAVSLIGMMALLVERPPLYALPKRTYELVRPYLLKFLGFGVAALIVHFIADIVVGELVSSLRDTTSRWLVGRSWRGFVVLLVAVLAASFYAEIRRLDAPRP